MKIGIIGPSFSVERIRSLIHMEDAYIECVEYPCSRNRVPDLLNKVQKDLDGVMFTGRRYFDFACRNVSATIPWTHTRWVSSGVLLRELFRASLSGRDITRITFDLYGTTSDKMLEVLSDTLELDANRIALYRYNDTKQYEEYSTSVELAGRYANGACKYHIENLTSGRASICLTDSPSVEAVLKKKGYPVYCLKPSREDVLSTLNELRTRVQLYAQQRETGHQEAVICLTVRLTEEYGHGNQEQRQIRSIARIEENIFVFAQNIGAAVEKRSGGQYMIFAAKGDLDVATDELRNIGFAGGLLSAADVEQVAMGIGFGTTHGIAKLNALQANKSARQQLYSCYYVKDGGELARGPFLIETQQTGKEFHEVMLERIARDTNVGITVLKALAKAQQQYDFQTVTSSELANMTGMSLNNIHRIVAKLEAKGYAEIVGQQSYAETGRPRRLIRLNLGFVPQGSSAAQ